MAIPPVTIFAAAALVVTTVADEEVELLPVEVAEALVPVDAVLSVVDRELELELVTFARLDEVETILVDEEEDEVLEATEEVKLGLVERCTVVVVPELDPDPVAEEEVEPLPLTDEEPPTTWNGFEYWKVGVASLAVESRTIWNP